MKSKLVQAAESTMRAEPGVEIVIGNEPVKVITGKITVKKYKCTCCGHISEHSTNHYGEIYPKCSACGRKNPMRMGQVHVCLEPVPAGWGTPEPWKTVTLEEIKEVKVCVK